MSNLTIKKTKPVNGNSLLPSFSVLALAGVMASLTLTATAQADTVYASGFEQPTFAVGAQLLGQDGWSDAIPPFLNPAAALVTDSIFQAGSQAIEIQGADLVGSYRCPVDLAVAPDKSLVRVDADLMLETTKRKTADEFFSMTLAARSGNGETLGKWVCFPTSKLPLMASVKLAA